MPQWLKGIGLHVQKLDVQAPIGGVVTGLPATGKTTILEKLSKEGIPCIDGDEFGMPDHIGGHALTSDYKHMRWLFSEMDELAFGSSDMDTVDAVMDALGIMFNWFIHMDVPAETRQKGWDAYVASQEERGRPRHVWYDYMEDMLSLDNSELVDVVKDRYEGDPGEDQFNMYWDLDIDMIIDAAEQGYVVFVIGSNWRSLFDRLASNDKIFWAHMSCSLGTTVSRLRDRAAAQKEESSVAGSHDIPWHTVLPEFYKIQNQAGRMTEWHVYSTKGRWTIETFRSLFRRIGFL